MKYKKGQRVKHVEYGEGTIIDIDNEAWSAPYLVEYDNKMPYGHDGLKFSRIKGKEGHCRWDHEEDIMLVEDKEDNKNK